MEKTVAAVGFCCADVYEKLNKFYPTGNGVDWGVHLARMGVPVSVVSVVGTDSYGEKMKEALAAEGIDISHLRTEPGDTCKMMMDLKNGTDRVHLEEIEGVMADYALTDEEFGFVAGHTMLHTDLFGKVLDRLPAWKAKGVQVVMDFSVFSEDPEYQCETVPLCGLCLSLLRRQEGRAHQGVGEEDPLLRPQAGHRHHGRTGQHLLRRHHPV